MKCKRDSDGRSHDHHTLQVMRQQAVKALKKGESAASIANVYGVNERTVYRWMARYIEGGQNALLAKPISGRPSKVTEEQMLWLGRAVQDHTPVQFKFEFALWTLSIIRELLKREFGVSLAISTVHRIMKLLGFSAQKPLYQAWQQDEVLVKQWERDTFPAIRKQAKAEGATIYFADESGLRSDYHTGTSWAPKGETPVLQSTGRRFSLNMISAVSPQGHFRFMLHQGSVTAKVFREFLKRLLVGTDKPVFVVVDGHPIHKAKLIKEFIEKQQGKLKLFFLPPYSPHLNPDETVWGHVKREASKKVIQDLDGMKRLAISALRRIQKLPDLVKSFFQQPECQYIIN